MRRLNGLAIINDQGLWEPGIGDPSFMGWLVVLAYTTALALSAWCYAWRSRLAQVSLCVQYGRFWLLLSGLLLFLAINKQLDLQTWLGHTARSLSKQQGWYHHRREWQRLFIIGVALSGGVAVVLMLWMMRVLLHRIWFVSIGIAVLCSFIVMRAASFHHMDDLLSQDFIGPFKANHALELLGIVLVSLGAVVNLTKLKTEGP